MAQYLKTSREDMKRPESKKASLPDVTRFFKPIFGEGYSEFLYLPPEITQTMEYMVDEETHLQDSSGQIWPITISFVNGFLAFHKGWNEFFLGHQLTIGQILVFQHVKGSSRISVKIYGTNACEVLDCDEERCGMDEDNVGTIKHDEGTNENVNARRVVFPSNNNIAKSSPANDAEILFPEILSPHR